MAAETKDILATCLWFDKNGEEAARFYVDLFPDSSIDRIMHAPADYPFGKAGDVLLVEFTLSGRRFQALNGGPNFHFTEAVSLSIDCDSQAEVDRYHAALSAHPENEACSWVKDRFGLSWQIVPRIMTVLMNDPDREKARRVMEAMMTMKKIDIAAIEAAARG
ncbi:VOC family protein [Jiella sonneratiae]|uniref:VOC family protein n=1 Tax=Jiella sonneratiae TaxID=2816856 RepID=A0ABS3J953_9HYPH|nr:VOC family protein [Jiella sonneratiae]MBO0906201.1 VOC family protein [Jiella sonneratiae]